MRIARDSSGVPADRAMVEATERYAAELERLGDPYLRQRAADVREVGRLLLAELRGAGSSRLEGLERPSVVFADDLSPADILGAPGADPGPGHRDRGAHIAHGHRGA